LFVSCMSQRVRAMRACMCVCVYTYICCIVKRGRYRTKCKRLVQLDSFTGGGDDLGVQLWRSWLELLLMLWQYSKLYG